MKHQLITIQYVAIFSLISLSLSSKFSNALEIDLTKIQPKAKIEFLATGAPSFIKIKGTGATATGIFDALNNKVSFETNLIDFKTGISLRDDHLHKALESEQYPKSKLTVTVDPNMVKNLSAASTQDFKGTLMLHGVEKDISGQLKSTDENLITAEFKILLSDFKIKAPEYLGAKVKDEVIVKAEVSLK